MSSGAPPPAPMIASPGPSRVVAVLLAFFLGGLGIHKFYLGRVVQGVLYLVFCWTLIPSLISVFEGIYYLVLSEPAFQRKYGRP